MENYWQRSRSRVPAHLLLWLAALLLLAGCAPGPGRNTLGQADVTITYRREGGLAGQSQEWVIHLDGRVEAPGDKEMQVPAEDVEAIIEQGAALAEPPTTPEPAPCCDRFTYSLTFSVGAQETTFTVYDGAPADAEELQMFADVEGLLNTAEPLP